MMPMCLYFLKCMGINQGEQCLLPLDVEAAVMHRSDGGA
jgi:hypothetical protein